MLSKKITIHTNDPDNSELSLSINGIVDRFAEITPRTVKLSGSFEQNISQKISIKANRKYPFSILGFWVKKGDNIKVNFKNISAKERGWVLFVTNTKKQSGKYFDQIILKTDHSEIPEIKISVHGNISNEKRLNNRPPYVEHDGPPILNKSD